MSSFADPHVETLSIKGKELSFFNILEKPISLKLDQLHTDLFTKTVFLPAGLFKKTKELIRQTPKTVITHL